MSIADNPYDLHDEIMDAAAASGLDRLIVKGEAPTAVFGPGDQVDITFNIDQSENDRWDTLVVSPSADEPPRWLVRLTNIIEQDDISSHPDPDSEEPSHDSVRDAMMIVSSKLAGRIAA